MRTRYAPTPSGYLHLGNAAHLVLVSSIARERDAHIHLRIDDVDAHRFRHEYLADIFDLLDWLALPWDTGPRSTTDMAQWSQQTRRISYERALDLLVETGRAYTCVCSRTQWAGYAGDECPGGCRSMGRPFTAGETTWRIHLPGHRDPIVWRRDDLPAYHLTSIVDDDAQSVDLAVRGQDLAESTVIQRRISALMPGSTFHTAHVLHHPLILDSSGTKMSKSAGSQGEPLPRTGEFRQRILDLAEQLAQQVTPDPTRSP